jgi:asparagine synthase (glutamine-hydrolysing)
VALGHARLAIIDLATGDQPLYSEDGTIALVANGEVYNHRELRAELEAAGHVFASRTDSEVIVHLYEQSGLEGITRLSGMFAFALWDARRRRLLLARDRAGIKPLYYFWRDGALLFASELRVLADAVRRRFPLELDRDSLWHYLSALYVPTPGTIWRGVRALPPGHLACLEDGALRERRYWEPPAAALFAGSRRDAVDELEALLAASVRRQRQADVPLGAYLSGGVDSSLVVSTLALESEEPVRTFTARIEGEGFDEAPFAEALARAYGTEHRSLRLGALDFDLLGEIVARCGQPLADPSILPTFLVSRALREHVTVALGGDGADELFAGYDKYAPLAGLPAGAAARRAVEAGFFRVPRSLKEELALPGFRVRAPDTFECLAAQVHAAGASAAGLMRQLDFRFFLESDVLIKLDVASMASSLEARVPLLDDALVDFAWSLPETWLVDGGPERKGIPRDLLARRMPEAFARRPKVGFTLPIGPWLSHCAEGAAHGLARSRRLRELDLFDPAGLEKLAGWYRRGVPQAENLLFALLMLDAWLERE